MLIAWHPLVGAAKLCFNRPAPIQPKPLEDTMKAFIATAVLSALALSAHAADEMKTEPTTQQSKMVTCNKEAAEKKGDERKAFMKDCLSAKVDGRAAQQNKMKSCNSEAGEKKGDERKAFMKDCLSKG
jgi:psiF repeat